MLEPLPDHRESVIVVGTSVRKPLPILTAYLDSLAWQELPPRTRLHYVFVQDFAPGQEMAAEHLRKWVGERGGEVIRGQPGPVGDFSDANPETHQWSGSAMARVGQNKNRIIRRALELKADAVFFADADLILDRTTIASLIAAEKPIATAVYWTRWSKSGSETRRIHSAPQVWLRHPYELSGRGMDEAEFREKLVNRELFKVYGYGACTLIARKVLEAGVSFDYLPDVPLVGLMAGEDRHFCLSAERRHIDAYADGWPDIFHIYHPEDVEKIPEMVKRLGTPHPKQPQLGDLVSLRLRGIEPIPVRPGQLQHPFPTWARGRIGALPLAPEVEEAVLGMTRGERQVVRVHHPIHHPVPYLRNRVRLVEVSLIDCKRNWPAPTIEEELYVGMKGGRSLDHTTLTQDQHDSIGEAMGVA